MRPGMAPKPRRRRSRRQRWLVIATAAASALVMVVAGGLSLFFGHLNGNITTQSMAVIGNLPPPSRAGVLNIKPESRTPTSPAARVASVQTRNASENICSGLPTPNSFGEHRESGRG
jgi:hypothetical protein